MVSVTRIFVPFCVAILSCAASAQIIPTGQFSGQQSETFEGQTGGPCVVGRIFGGTADVCDPQSSALLVTSGWSFQCQINPHSGITFAGSAGGPAVFTFDSPANKFGGFFGTNCGTADATVKFRDVNGSLIASLPMTVPADCGWTWSGFQVTAGLPVKTLEIVSIFGGGFIMMDDLQVDYGSPCAPPVSYCTAKVNSLGCTPTIQWAGTPSASLTTGCLIQGLNVRNNKMGLLIYSMNGRASTNFSGGLLCLVPPVRRSPLGNSGGSAAPVNDCSGTYSVDMNALAHHLVGATHPPHPLLTVPGTVVDCQYWGQDPGFPAPNNTTLSNALEFVVCP